MLLRGLVGAGGKVLIATATASALGHDHTLVRMREVLKPFAGLIVIDNSSDRDFQDDAFAVASGAVGAFAVASALAFVFRIEAEMDERIVPLAGFHHDVAATAAIAAGGSAARDKLLPAKGHASVATVAAFDPDDCFVNKHAVYIDCTGREGDSPQRTSPVQSRQEDAPRDQAAVNSRMMAAHTLPPLT